MEERVERGQKGFPVWEYMYPMRKASEGRHDPGVTRDVSGGLLVPSPTLSEDDIAKTQGQVTPG